MKIVAALFLTGLIMFVSSCSGNLEASKKAVAEASSAINDEFVKVRQAEETLVAKVSELYAGRERLDLSTKGMDAKDGGNYETFPGGKYYFKKQPVGSALYASPGRAVDEAIRRQVKFLEYVDPYLQVAGKASDLLVTAFYGVRDPITIALMNPWFDVVSRLPPGIDLNMFEWYQRGVKSGTTPVWSAKPFTDLSTGWVMDLSAGVVQDGKNVGVAVISIDLAKLALKHVKASGIALVLMGSDTTVVGLNPEAEAIVKIPPLQSVDYLKQIKENTFAPATYQLTDASHPVAIQDLGKAVLSGKTEFPASIDGKNYTVVVGKVAENGMLVLSLSPN